MKVPSLATIVLTALMGCLAACLLGCGSKASPKADATELERVFGLKAGAPASDEPTAAGLASRAVAALRAQEWPKAVVLLEQIRKGRGLTAEQSRAVHNATANALGRVIEQADKGDADAQRLLEARKKSAK